MGRTLVVGDIHGCYEELVELLDRAAVSSTDTLVSIGDLVDRGPASVEVVRLFRSRPGAIVLMGNHERKHVRGILSYSQEITRLQFGEEYDELRRWMTSLPYYLETDSARIVHAAMIPGLSLAQQREEVLCGSTSGERQLVRLFGDRPWYESYTDDEPMVFGHRVVGPEPLVHDERVFGIDTGACHGMRLSAVSLPDLILHSVAAREDHWTRQKEIWREPVLRSRSTPQGT
jgi:serine/threonine protein phosphatase 1